MRVVHSKPGYRGAVYWMTTQCFKGMELPTREEFDRAYDNDEVFIAQEFDQPEGYAMVHMGNGKVEGCYLQSIAILPEYRGYGVGRWLLQEVYTYCKLMNEARISLHCKKDSTVVDFYKNAGYKVKEVVKDHYLSDGDGYRMEIIL